MSTISAAAVDIASRPWQSCGPQRGSSRGSQSPSRQELGDGVYMIFSHMAFADGQPLGAGALDSDRSMGVLHFRFPIRKRTCCSSSVRRSLLASPRPCSTRRCAYASAYRCDCRLSRARSWILSLIGDGIWFFLLFVSQIVIPNASRSPRLSVFPDPRWQT